MNQGTDENILALNLSDCMAGTANPELEDDYNKVPRLAKDSYPDIDILLSVDPDFVYADYSSAFATSHINYATFIDDECDLVIERKGENRRYYRDEHYDKGIQTYLQISACELIEHRPVDSLEIANIFDVYDEACQLVNSSIRQLVDSIEGHFQQADIVAAYTDPDIPPISAL
jgi:hypothetical protein